MYNCLRQVKKRFFLNIIMVPLCPIDECSEHRIIHFLICSVEVSESAPPTTPLRDDTPFSNADDKAIGVADDKQGESGATSRTIPVTPPLPPITPREDSNQCQTNADMQSKVLD